MQHGSDPLRVLYLVYREGGSAVFASQVGGFGRVLIKSGIDVDFGVFCTLGEFVRPSARLRWKAAACKLDRAVRSRVRRFPCHHKWWGPSWDHALLALILWQRYGKRRPVILHCRNEIAACVALHVKRSFPNVRIILDYRGIGHAELMYRSERSAFGADKRVAKIHEAQEMFATEQKAAVGADAVLCVSRALVDYIVNNYGVERHKCVVVPCCVDTAAFARGAQQRLAMRAQLGFGDRLVVVYCGSLHPWQLPRQSLRLFRVIQGIVPGAHFLAVTTEPQGMYRAATAEGIEAEAMTVVSVSHAEVPQYLAAADIGLLVREQSPVNAVSSPVKFGEYLASGLPVILTERIGDYSELTRRERVGVVLPVGGSPGDCAMLKSFLAQYRSSPAAWRARCLDVACRHLDAGVYLPQILSLYQQLCK